MLGWQPAPPLILPAWHDTSAELKMLRLTEHIEWAAQQGALEVVARFLRGLREEDWFAPLQPLVGCWAPTSDRRRIRHRSRQRPACR